MEDTRIKIMVGCNTLTSVSSVIYPHHCLFWYDLGKNLSKDYQFFFNTPRRLTIDNMRNDTAKRALLYDCRYILFYDDDTIFPTSSLTRLLETMKKTGAAVVGGLTYVRKYPYLPMVFQRVVDEVKEIEGLCAFETFEEYTDADGLFECGAIGFSLALLDCEYIKKLQTPYFITGGLQTEDVYYCMRLRKNIDSNVKIVCDTKVEVTHLVDSYAVDHTNVKRLREFEEEIFEVKPKSIDRTQEYLESVKSVIKKSEVILDEVSDKVSV
jgi:hypothetical protein